MKEDNELYSEIENLIIRWSNDGDKTAGHLTRQIMETLSNEKHKGLTNLLLINPVHLQMTSNGHGEFPDGYKLTEKGVQHIIDQLNVKS